MSRRTSRSAKNDIFSSRYGMMRDTYGIRCGQYDDAPCHEFGKGYGGCRCTAANNRGQTRRSFSRTSTPKRKVPRFHELACAKRFGCDPSCKYPRCASNDPYYAVPFYEPQQRQDRKTFKKIEQFPSTSVLRNTCSRMAKIREIFKRVGDKMTMGLKYLQEVQDSKNLDVLPMLMLNCDGNCAECDATPRESIRGGTGRGDGIPKRISTRTPKDTELKPPATKTVASNTEVTCYGPPEFREAPTTELKVVNSNSAVETLNKQTSPIPPEKTPATSPVPRVALQRPPRPGPPSNIPKKDQQMIRYARQQQERLTPQPKDEPLYGRHLPSTPKPKTTPPPPLVPLYGHDAPSALAPRATPPPPPPPTLPSYDHEVPSQPNPEMPPFHHLETSTPASLTSRREATPSRMHPSRQKWLPRKLSPRLQTPPVVEMTYPTRTPSISPCSEPPKSPPPKSPLPRSTPAKSPTPTHPQASPPPPIPTADQLSKAISPLTSEYDSDATSITDTTSNSNSNSDDSGTATVCLCSLCGKSENATAIVYKNNNNPLYDLASPLQSPARAGFPSVATLGRNPSRVCHLALEVIVLLVLGGLVTLGLMSLVESVFGAYLAGTCGGATAHGPVIVADGLKSGLMNWISCRMDDTRATAS